jgi:hypothetical protein
MGVTRGRMSGLGALRCGRGVAGVLQRTGRGAAMEWPGGMAEVPKKSGRDAAEEWLRCGRRVYGVRQRSG